MNRITTTIGIDNPNNPTNKNFEQFCPLYELDYVDTEPLNPAKIPLTKIVNATVCAGSYGMGGPGFFAIDFESGEQLLMTLWGVEDWMTINGILIYDLLKSLAPSIKEKVLSGNLSGRKIRAFQIRKHSFWMLLSDAVELEITENPIHRNSNKIFSLEDDLRDAFILLPKPYNIWV